MKKILYFSAIVTAVILGITGCGEEEEVVISGIEETEETAEAEGYASEEESPESVFVYVVGAVNKPGVYEVPAGTRIFNVLDSAGGLREDAAAEGLNLAAVVQDASVIRVPDRQEYSEIREDLPGITYGGDKKGLININSASVSELTTLNGIGESRAQAIVSYREENGFFNSIEDIKNVSGIKDGLFNKIKDQITV